jgi:maltose O-acetyltransferase
LQGKEEAMGLKRFFWRLPKIIRNWHWYFIQDLPNQFGKRLRARWAKKYFGSVGKNLDLHEGFAIQNPDQCFVGDNVIIARGCHFNAGGGLYIKDYVGFGPGVKVWTVNHKIDNLDIPIPLQGSEYGKITIEEGAWIAANAIILPNPKKEIVIGKGAVIGAGSVLAKSVPPYSICMGNPARVIGYRDKLKKDEFSSEGTSGDKA